MKRLFLLVIFCFFPVLLLKAAHLEFLPIESEKTKERILRLKNGHTIYIFSDNTIVYLRKPPYETQTWSEWWNNVEHIQPDPQFYFQLEKWNNSPAFQLYQYQWKESSSSHPLENLFYENIRLFDEYPYFIENKKTGQMTLCQIWSLIDLGAFIGQYGEECYNKGYHDGYNDGYDR